MKFIQYFDGHVVINFFGLLIRIKYELKYDCPKVTEYGLNRGMREIPITVSLTSFPARINIVSQTIASLLNQTMKPDTLVLWLAPEQFPNGEADLPQELVGLKQYGLTIDWYKDIRPYKKIIPTLKKYPHTVIITTDDDICYTPDTIETLYNSYLAHKDEIHAHRADILSLVESQEGKTERPIIQKAKTRELYADKYKGKSSFRLALTGYGGVLYPPDCFHKDICSEELFKLIPTHDDVWLWAMSVLGGYKTRLVKGYSESINYVKNSQECGLCKINKKGCGMPIEEAYRIISERYPKILELLKQEPEEE